MRSKLERLVEMSVTDLIAEVAVGFCTTGFPDGACTDQQDGYRKTRPGIVYVGKRGTPENYETVLMFPEVYDNDPTRFITSSDGSQIDTHDEERQDALNDGLVFDPAPYQGPFYCWTALGTNELIEWENAKLGEGGEEHDNYSIWAWAPVDLSQVNLATLLVDTDITPVIPEDEPTGSSALEPGFVRLLLILSLNDGNGDTVREYAQYKDTWRGPRRKDDLVSQVILALHGEIDFEPSESEGNSPHPQYHAYADFTDEANALEVRKGLVTEGWTLVEEDE